MQKSGQLLFRLLVIAFPFLAASSRSPKITGLALVFGNLLPLVGVMFFDWSVMEILWIYWAESAIIGVLNVASMILSATHDANGTFEPLGLMAAVPLSAFFCVHFGGFMFGHAVFFGVLPEIAESSGLFQSDALSVNILEGPAALLTLFGCPLDRACTAADVFASPVSGGVAALLMSHGVSFYVHFLRGREYYHSEMMQLFIAPYKRIIVMQITIILGAFALVALATLFPDYAIQSLAGIWVVIKIIVDLQAHWRAHRTQLAAEPAPNAALPTGNA